MALHLPNEPLKPHSGLESVPRCEPSTYQPISLWLSHCAIGAGLLQHRKPICHIATLQTVLCWEPWVWVWVCRGGGWGVEGERLNGYLYSISVGYQPLLVRCVYMTQHCSEIKDSGCCYTGYPFWSSNRDFIIYTYIFHSHDQCSIFPCQC